MRAQVALVIVLVAGRAAAEPPPPPVAPTATRVVQVPTAWLLPSMQLQVSAGASHRAGALASASLGVGDVAEVDLDLTDRLQACDPCEGDRAVTQLYAASALFKIGLATRRDRAWRTGLALGLRRSIATRAATAGGRTGELDTADLYLVAGGGWRGVELHGGAGLQAARHAGVGLGDYAARVRPFLGLAWTPAPYPRTTLVVDVGWSPEVQPAGPALTWAIGWGVRYQALRYGSIELAVRNRQDEALGAATVFVRVNGALALGHRLGEHLR